MFRADAREIRTQALAREDKNKKGGERQAQPPSHCFRTCLVTASYLTADSGTIFPDVDFFASFFLSTTGALLSSEGSLPHFFFGGFASADSSTGKLSSSLVSVRRREPH